MEMINIARQIEQPLNETDAFNKVYEVKEHMHNYARIIVPHCLVGKTVKLVEVKVTITEVNP